MYYYLGNNRGILKTNKGAKLYVDTREKSITPHLITDSFWEPNITHFLFPLIKKGMTIIEIGANIGYYTTMMASSVGKEGHVYSFEPNNTSFALLSDNVWVNGLSKRVTLYNRAVSNHVGFSMFTTLAEHGVSSSLLPPESLSTVENGLYRYEKKDQIQVVTTTIDVILPNIKVDLMKIDAEGFEYHIFEGMTETLKNNPKMQLIVEFVPEYLNLASKDGASKLLTLITHLGYKLKHIDELGRTQLISIDDALNSKYLELYLSKS